MGIGDWAQSPIPNPQSPIPNPQSPLIKNFYKNIFFEKISLNINIISTFHKKNFFNFIFYQIKIINLVNANE